MDYVQNDISDYHSFQTPPGLWGLSEEQIKQLQANFSLPKHYKHYIRTIWAHTFCFKLKLKFKTVYCHQSLKHWQTLLWATRLDTWPLFCVVCDQWCLPAGTRGGGSEPKGTWMHGPPSVFACPVNHSSTWCDNPDSDCLKFPHFGGNAQ